MDLLFLQECPTDLEGALAGQYEVFRYEGPKPLYRCRSLVAVRRHAGIEASPFALRSASDLPGAASLASVAWRIHRLVALSQALGMIVVASPLPSHRCKEPNTMTLKESTRRRLHAELAPLIGEEAIDDMLGQFPASDRDQPATAHDLALLRGEIQVEMSELRVEMADLRTEVRTDMAGLHVDMADLRTELHDGLRKQTVWLVGAVAVIQTLVVAASNL